MTGLGTSSAAFRVQVSPVGAARGPTLGKAPRCDARSRHCAARSRPDRGCAPAATNSLFADNDVGRVGMLHSDDMIAGIDMMNLTRDAAREIAEEIHRGVADFLDRHAPPQRRIVLVPFENVAKVADPRRR